MSIGSVERQVAGSCTITLPKQYLEVLPDEVLEEYIALQTGIPRGTLADKMIANLRDS